jgi:predicted glycosyltransferase
MPKAAHYILRGVVRHMSESIIILATSNGVGMGHLARASAVALALLIKSTTCFEHLISGSSPAYLIRRKEIAQVAYGKPVEIVQR